MLIIERGVDKIRHLHGTSHCTDMACQELLNEPHVCLYEVQSVEKCCTVVGNLHNMVFLSCTVQFQ
jgi:hypothetical protein